MDRRNIFVSVCLEETNMPLLKKYIFLIIKFVPIGISESQIMILSILMIILKNLSCIID